MIDRKFELRQNPPETKNEDLPDNQAFTSQDTILTSEDGSRVAEIEAYLDSGYYSFYWQTTKPESELVQLAEECVKYYEGNFPEGVVDLMGEQTDPFGKKLPSNKYASGVIMFVRESGKSDRLELDYQRPLNWEQIVDAANGREVTLARFDTPIGDFCIQQLSTTRIFGVISHLRETTGFAELLAKSGPRGIGLEQAQQLLDKAISSFPAKPQQ